LNGIRKEKFDLPNALVAGLVFIISLVIYLRTVAPTLSFWDCGEFIACSHILGIAHPPGSPLYLLIGRIFSMIPSAQDIAYRVNLFSVVASSAMALFGYLVVVRLIRKWYDDQQDILHRIIAYVGGFTGALFAAFATTNWSNSVEAEVYASAMALMLIVYWLALKYENFKETPVGTRAMILALYLGMLGVGIHLTMYLVVPVIALYAILKRETGPREWGLVALFFASELYLIFSMSSRPDEIPYYIPVVIMALIYIFHLALNSRYNKITLITLLFYLVALYPFYFVLLNAARGGGEMSPALASTANIPIGWLALIGMALYGLYALYQRLYGKVAESDKRDWQMAAVYSLIPLGLILVDMIFKGYYHFLFLTVILFALLAAAIWKKINVMILIAVTSMSMIILGFYPFIYGLIAGVAVILLLARFTGLKGWKVGIAIILLAAIGFSVHIFIPIRSADNPSIDQNDPSRSMAALVGYLERKQYGSESMTERMFTRRGEWENQFGDYQRMGFWRFFKEQYGFDGPWFVIVLILGVFGVWETIRRKPSLGLPLMVLILLCTVGLVLYMNFADGTRMIHGRDYLEVRNRDYFFTPGFIFFGLAIGMGISALIDLVKDTFSGGSRGTKYIATGVASLLVLLPIVPIANNYFENDRSRNYMAYDYAYNLLISCDKDAILVTNGDNDTFPVWCLQEAYGFRTDVKIVNLSLGNLDWYIRQLREYHNVPISWTDEEIKRLRPYRTPDGKEFRIQDQLIDNILATNRWRYPFQMTVTTPDNNRRYRGESLDPYLVLQGMTFNLYKTKGSNRVDYDKSKELYWNEFKYRGIADSSVYLDEAAKRLTDNYAQGFLWLADSMRVTGDLDAAMAHIRKGLEYLPRSWDLYGYGAQLYSDMGKRDTIEAFLKPVPLWKKKEIYLHWGMLAGSKNDLGTATYAFRRAYLIDSNYTDAFQALATTYYRRGVVDSLRALITEWLARHPNDNDTRQLFNELQKMPDSTLKKQGSG